MTKVLETPKVQNKAVEIIPGLTVEEMSSLFYDSTEIKLKYRLYQLNSSGHRYYYRISESGEPIFYPSVTTVISQTLPKSDFLIKWMANTGLDESEAFKRERADYGTFMHSEFQLLLMHRVYNLDEMKGRLLNYMEMYNLPPNFIYHADELKKDVLSLAQFIKDYDVRPLAIEICLCSDVYGYAGMLDLPCTMLENPGGKRRINAIVDFKSGKKGFWEEHEIQVHLYKDLWNENYPDHPMNKVFNFAPTHWKKRPGYKLTDQTASPNAEKIKYLLGIARVEDGKKENKFTSCSGIIDLDNDLNFDKNIITLTLSEVIKTRAKNDPVEVMQEKEDEKPSDKPQKPPKKAANKKNKAVVPKKAVKPKKQAVTKKITTKVEKPGLSDVLDKEIDF